MWGHLHTYQVNSTAGSSCNKISMKLHAVYQQCLSTRTILQITETSHIIFQKSRECCEFSGWLSLLHGTILLKQGLFELSPPLPLGLPGWCSDECYMWVEFAVGSCPCSDNFSLGSLVFLLPPNKHFLNFSLSGNSRATGLSVMRLLLKLPLLF